MDRQAQGVRDVGHVRAREDLAGLHDAAGVGLADAFELGAARAIDAGEAEDAGPDGLPLSFGSGAVCSFAALGVQGRFLEGSAAGKLAVDAGGGEVVDLARGWGERGEAA